MNKKMIMLLCLFSATFTHAQAYKGIGDIKGQVGALLQEWGTGLVVTADFGLGENISVGFVTSYLLQTKDINTQYVMYDPVFDPSGFPTYSEKAEFVDRIDVKARFNANLGNVFGFNKNMDLYPGLDLGLRNLGGHVGFRYFFTDGFGVYSETGFPIAKYDQDITGFDKLNNQFTFSIGASFNL